MMSIQVTTTESLNERRDNTKFCYLCGNSLPKSTGGTRPEHIVPISLLRLENTITPNARIPVILDVHSKCDNAYKAKQDNIIAAYHALHHIPPEKWGNSRANQIRRLFRNPINDPFGNPIPVVDATPLLNACMAWVRGMHTVLYGSFLPNRSDLFQIFAPQPNFHSGPEQANKVMSFENIRSLANEMDNFQNLIDEIISLGTANDCCDFISAWGDKLIFRSVWADWGVGKVPDKQLKATCFWTLTHPGIESVINGVDGSKNSWSGIYRYFNAPKDSANIRSFIDP